MSIYEKTNVARALLYWAKNNNGNEAYYLEDRMYAVADGDMVIILTADSYDEAIQKANGERPQGEIATNCNQIATELQQTQGDCISRSALKKSIEEYRSLNCVSTSTIIGVRNVVYLIDNAPTVDTYTIEDIKEVQEKSLILGAKLAQRPQGEWLAHEDMDEWYECNKCHCGNTYFDKLPNFCPNCGAKMKGGEKNDT